jgi:ABC-type sugar transport system ATPase subunit
MTRVYALMRLLAESGVAILMISKDMEEVLHTVTASPLCTKEH